LEVRWLHADLLAGIPDEFDAVLSNPPYVAEAERRALAPEIVRHEPAAALFAGADGLSSIRALLAQVADRRRLAVLGVEVGAGQAQEVAELMRRAGFGSVRSEPDLAGIERVLVAERGDGR
jgi:release factor glutamine methyltransferase